MNSRRKKQEGFTLIEIMVVILILGLLATLVVQSLRGATDKAKRTKAMADIAELKTALDRYYIDIGSYPTSDQGLAALVNPGGQGGTQVSSSGGSAGGSDDSYIQRIPNDPWGNPYVYASDGTSYTLKSYGADGVEGGTGKNADIDASQF
jgi:general secretion pathway protein G